MSCLLKGQWILESKMLKLCCFCVMQKGKNPSLLWNMGGISFGVLPYWVPLCWFQFSRQIVPLISKTSQRLYWLPHIKLTACTISFLLLQVGFSLVISLKSLKNLQGSFQYTFLTENAHILVSSIMVFWLATVRKSYL